MADKKLTLTENQERAITLTGKNVLVSASAGSGKTFVMIERIINLIINQGVNVENILAVTYTTLAADEMKKKLVSAIVKRINEGKDVERMKEALKQIPTANISTFHSFCLNLLRTYFFVAGVEPDFAICDEAESKDLSNLAIERVFNDLYEKEDEEFLSLVRSFRKYRSDFSLKENVLSLYKFAWDEAYPEEFLKECIDNISEEKYLSYEEILFNSIKEKLLAKFQPLDDFIIEFNGIQPEKNTDKVKDFLNSLSVIKTLISNSKNGRELLLATNDFPDTPRGSFSPILCDLKDRLKDWRKELTTLATNQRNRIPEDREADLNRFLATKKIASALVKVVLLFDEEFEKTKKEEGVLNFSDLEHKTLNLITNNPDVLTTIKEKFKYIFADEYQDVNGVQEEILSKISNDNLFMVGDVKQSIYAFRGCNPEIFAKKYERYEETQEGFTIPLDKNFRSSDKVLEAVNNVFSEVITKDFGGIDYKSNPMLRGGLFEKGYGESTVHVIEPPDPEKEPPREGVYDIVQDTLKEETEEEFYEGALIAKIIEDELKSTVFDVKQEKEREVRFSDITILARSTKHYAVKLINRLAKSGIPVSSESQVDITVYPEIKLLIDVLKLVCFYADDPPLISVLKSEIGKISDQELALIKLNGNEKTTNKEATFLDFVKEYEKSGENVELKGKLIKFEEYFDGIRTLSEFVGAGELLCKIMRDTGLDLAIASKNLGSLRLNRIERFIAESVPSGKVLSANEFLRRIETLGDKLTLSEIAGNDAVKVMSMHGSKGLEFPIVILAGLNRQFNAKDDSKEILTSRSEGFALYFYDEVEKKKYSTLTREFFKENAKRARIKEEARIFYVAMTRAQSKLHLVTTKPLKTERNSDTLLFTDNYYDFLLSTDMPIKTYDEKSIALEKSLEVRKVNLEKEFPSLTKKITKSISFKYPYEEDTKLPVKTTVTEINDQTKQVVKKVKKPIYNLPSEEDKAKTGTCYHLFLEKCDFSQKDGNKELIRLLSQGDMTEEEAKLLDVNLLNKILSLPVWDSLKGYSLYKEQPFITTFPARELFGVESDSEVVIQGIIDLLAVKDNRAIIIDYKTSDRGADELIATYKTQLLLYKKAIETKLNITVESTYILSLKTGELISI